MQLATCGSGRPYAALRTGPATASAASASIHAEDADGPPAGPPARSARAQSFPRARWKRSRPSASSTSGSG